jgi:hypothetical protein
MFAVALVPHFAKKKTLYTKTDRKRCAATARTRLLQKSQFLNKQAAFCALNGRLMLAITWLRTSVTQSDEATLVIGMTLAWRLFAAKGAQPMHRLIIPEDLRYADLNLRRDPNSGDLVFDWEPVERLCAANGLDESALKCDGDNVWKLLLVWYMTARRAGQPADAIQEQILAESFVERNYGSANVQLSNGTIH